MPPKRSRKTSVASPPAESDNDGSEYQGSDVSMADINDATLDDQPEASANKPANNAPNPTTRRANKKKPKRRPANEQEFGYGQLHQEFAAFRRLFQVFLDRTMPQDDGSTAMDVAMKPLSSRRPDCVVKTSFEPAESRKTFTGYYTEWMKALKQLDNVYHQVREIFVYDDYVNFTFKTPDAAKSFTPNKEDMFKALGSNTPVSCFQRADEHYYVELFFRGRDFRHTHATDAKKMLAELGLDSDKFSVMFREKRQRFIAKFTDMAEADRLLEMYENEGGTQGEGLLIDYSYAHLRPIDIRSVGMNCFHCKKAGHMMKRCPDKDEDPTCGWCGDRGHGQHACTSTVPRCAACKEEHCTQSVNCMDRNRRLHLRACAKFGPPAWPSYARFLRPHGRRDEQSRDVDSGSSGSAGASGSGATSEPAAAASEPAAASEFAATSEPAAAASGSGATSEPATASEFAATSGSASSRGKRKRVQQADSRDNATPSCGSEPTATASGSAEGPRTRGQLKNTAGASEKKQKERPKAPDPDFLDPSRLDRMVDNRKRHKGRGRK